MAEIQHFFEELKKSVKRARERDPITFWCSIWGILTGNVAIFLQLWRLFR